ncbi:MAG: polysaccharide biosynthesis C-terminal domain-containing protein [Chloroflexi bacterium]|nr:polysaccharide biosynthesis C-terminal domain-containing protein [Chloroflexota bacterium]MBI3732686.1 polysaccharide biosynthesis C-terminal domain-containing protein [Chloroflexota bacterium]
MTHRAGAFLTFFTNFGTYGITAISGVLLARALEAQGRGELAAIVLWPSLILSSGGLGIPSTTAYFASQARWPAGTVYGTFLWVAVAQSLVLMAAGWIVIPIALQSHDAGIIALSHWYLLTIPLSLAGGISHGALQGTSQLGKYNLARSLSPVVYFLGIAALWLAGALSVEAATTLLLTIGFISAAGSVWLVIWQSDTRLRWNSGLAREIFGYGFKTQLANTTQWLNLRLDQLILSVFLPAQSLGYYAVAVTLSQILSPLGSSMAILTLPAVARQTTAEAGLLRLRLSLRRGLSLLIAGGIVLVIALPWLTPLLVGGSYLPAIGAAQVLVLGAILLGFNDISTEGLRGLGRPMIPAISQLLSLVVTGLLLAFLLPSLGILGAAMASVAAYATVALIHFFYLSRYGLKLSHLTPQMEDWLDFWQVIVSAYRRLAGKMGRLAAPSGQIR